MTVYQSKPKSRLSSRKTLRRWIVVSVLSVALLAGVAAVSLWAYGRSLNSNLDRVDAISPMVSASAAAEEPVPTGPLNILIVGSDSRDPEHTQGSRTDTIMLAHVDKNREHVYLSSIARDTWTDIPGEGKSKINAAFALGGASLLVKTVEQYTGVHIDHFVMIDFGGLEQVVNALGGVDMTVEKTIKSIHAPYRTFAKGKHTFNGAEALDWVRQRKQFADGDFSRQRHQQELISAVITKATQLGILADPLKLNDFLQSVTNAVTVDQQFDLIKTALALRSLRASNMIYLTSPNKGVGMVGDQSVVLPDPAKAKLLYASFKNDTVAQYLAASKTK